MLSVESSVDTPTPPPFNKLQTGVSYILSQRHEVRHIIRLPSGEIAIGTIGPNLSICTIDGLSTRIITQSSGAFCLTIAHGYLICGDGNNFLNIWEQTGHLSHKLQNDEPIICVAELPGDKLALGGENTNIYIWDLQKRCIAHLLRGHSKTVCQVAIVKESLVSASWDNTLRVWNPDTGTCLHHWNTHTSSIFAFANLDNDRIVSASGDKTLRIWEIGKNESLCTLHKHTDAVVCVRVSKNRIFSSSFDQTVCIWDARTGQCRNQLDCGETAFSLAYCALSDTILAGTYAGKVYRWSSDGVLLQLCHEHAKSVTCLTLLPTGDFVSGSNDGTIRLWTDPTVSIV